MIGLFRGTADSGLYSAGVRVAWLTQAGLMAANMIVAPLSAELHAKSEPMALRYSAC